jgi:hypothetical protein
MEFDLAVIRQEAEMLTMQPGSKDWLSIARNTKISQTDLIPKPDTVCYLKHGAEPYSLLTRGSVSTFTGKAKAGKTSVLALIVASSLAYVRVLWIDTEQGTYYSSLTQHYILRIAGLSECANLEMYDLRTFNPQDIISIIDALLKAGKYDLIVLDGVRDIVFDINNPEEATTTITKLMMWSVDFNCHVAMVLHQNKGNNDVRGHLGTEAINKSEIVVSVNKTGDDSGNALVSAEYSRGLPFKDFFVSRNEDGLPFIDSEYVQQTTTPGRKKLMDPIEVPDGQHLEILNLVFKHSDGLTSGDFYSALSAAWTSTGGDNMSLTRAKPFRSYYVQKAFIVQESNQKGNKTINRLNEKYRVG